MGGMLRRRSSPLLRADVLQAHRPPPYRESHERRDQARGRAGRTVSHSVFPFHTMRQARISFVVLAAWRAANPSGRGRAGRRRGKARRRASRDGRWWRIYEDPALESFVDEAFSSNADLVIAAARVDEARACSGGAILLLPQVDAQGRRAASASPRAPRWRLRGSRANTHLPRDAEYLYELDLRCLRPGRAARAELRRARLARAVRLPSPRRWRRSYTRCARRHQVSLTRQTSNCARRPSACSARRATPASSATTTASARSRSGGGARAAAGRGAARTRGSGIAGAIGRALGRFRGRCPKARSSRRNAASSVVPAACPRLLLRVPICRGGTAPAAANAASRWRERRCSLDLPHRLFGAEARRGEPFFGPAGIFQWRRR